MAKYITSLSRSFPSAFSPIGISRQHSSLYLYSLPPSVKMLSLRAFTRTIPRTVSRSIATTSRASFRPVAAVPKNTFLQSSLKQATKPAYAAFSTSSTFKQAEGKIQSILVHENAYGPGRNKKPGRNNLDFLSVVPGYASATPALIFPFFH